MVDSISNLLYLVSRWFTNFFLDHRSSVALLADVFSSFSGRICEYFHEFVFGAGVGKTVISLSLSFQVP